MTQEQIEKKAKAYANEFSEEQEYYDEYEAGKKFGRESGFKAGAKWRIESVWHKPEEKPENNRMILIIMQHNIPTVLGPDNSFFKEEVKDRLIQRWAYIEDLLS